MPRDDDDELVDEEWIPEGDEGYDEVEQYESEIIEEEDGFREDEFLLVVCPACGAEVIAEVGKCPSCGEYLIDHDRPGWAGRSWWWIALALAGVAAVIYTSTVMPWM